MRQKPAIPEEVPAADRRGFIATLLIILSAAAISSASCSPAPRETPTPTIVVASPTVPASATPSPTATALPVVPTATPTASPSPSPSQTPAPTPTVDHFGSNGIDQRFGVVTTDPGRAWQLSELQVDWYLDYTNTVDGIPAGKNKMLFIPMLAGEARMTPQEIKTRAAAYPGAAWYLGGEPNVPSGGRYMRITPEEYIPEFHYYAEQIRAADPTALITGPSILNWDFTCSGCGGYTSGEEWMRRFVDGYTVTYGAPPEVDIWTIDSYPLTWDNLPTTAWGIVAQQVERFRQYLVDEVPGHAETPIWITELAAHWAYDSFRVEDWEAEYEWAAMEWYMTNLIDWLRENSDRLDVEKWFFFRTYVDPEKQSATDSYAGIYFFESPEPDAALNQLGRLYRDQATGVR